MSAADPTRPIPVRLAESMIRRLDAAAKNMGTNRAALIRFLVFTFTQGFVRRGLRSLPHDWQEIMKELDGRTLGQQHILHVAGPDPSAPTDTLQTADSPAMDGAANLPRKPVKFTARNTRKKH